LIRKHNLPTTVAQYTAKRPESILKKALPVTFPFELAYLDDLDELLIDDLYELQQAFDSHSDKWWILKPGLADKGQGTRLFRTREQLEAIFEEFNCSDSEEEEVSSTKVSLQTMRHWVVQVGGKNLPPDARLKRERRSTLQTHSSSSPTPRKALKSSTSESTFLPLEH
jgi:tubulin--tyrosine ligase